MIGAVVAWWQLRVAMRESDRIPAHGSIWAGLRGRRAAAGPSAVPAASDQPSQAASDQTASDQAAQTTGSAR
jgi:hypothetical protein